MTGLPNRVLLHERTDFSLGLCSREQKTFAIVFVDPDRFKQILTESILIRGLNETLTRLNALPGQGVRLSIDDFGTGYSSLAYLKRFPVQKLKIDRPFVDGLPDDESDLAIIRAIIQLGLAMRLKVIAEGVETEGRKNVLLALGCHEFQGYFYAAAIAAKAAPKARMELLCVDRRLKLGAGRKLRGLAGGDLQFGAGLRVAADARGARTDAEIAKTDQADRIARHQCLGHDLGQAIDGARGSGFGQIAFGGQGFDQFALVHMGVPLLG